MVELPQWVKDLTGDNLLAVYDVVLDIREELQLTNSPSIQLCRTIVRFSTLMPVDGIDMRDRYCELRWKATELLKDRNIIDDYKYVEMGHRWKGKIDITAEKEAFFAFAAALDEEFKNRLPENEGHDQEPEEFAASAESKTTQTSLAYPERVTLHWLATHVHWKVWTGAAIFIGAVFIAGIHVGQLSFVKEMFGFDESSSISDQTTEKANKASESPE
jgi:hypothetical protein